MATDIERLVVQLSADIKGYQSEMQKAVGITNRQARAVEARWKQSERNLNAIGSSMARGLIAPLTGVAAALTTREILSYADAWTRTKNSLAVAGVTGAEQVAVLDRLYQSAQANFVPIEDLASVYGKAAMVQGELGASSEDLIKFSDGVAASLYVAGTSAEAARGALLQLGQALGSSRVMAEEFNSIQEGARPILIAVAKGLDAAGGSVSKLKKLVTDGNVSNREFFQAALRGFPAIAAMSANATQTIQGGVTNVTNAMTKYIGQTDESLGASQRLIAGLNALANNFNETANIVVQLASIIAGALVGRAIGGMIANLGLATTAVTKFVGALRAATTMGSVITAIGGVATAAGPIGLVVGATAVTALALFAARSHDAGAGAKVYAEEVKRLRAELNATNDAHGKLNETITVTTARALVSGVKNARSEAKKETAELIRQVSSALKDENFWDLWDKGDLNDAMETQVSDLLDQLSSGKLSATGFADALSKLGEDNAGVARFADGLQDFINTARIAEQASTSLAAKAQNAVGTTLVQLKDKANELQDKLVETFDSAMFLPTTARTPEFKAIEELIAKAKDGKLSTEDLARAMATLDGSNVHLSGPLAALRNLIGALKEAKTAAEEANVAATIDRMVASDRAKADADYKAKEAGQSFLADLAKQNALSKDQIALEKEMAAIRKEAQTQAPGASLSDEDIKKAAQDRLAAEKRRSAEGKKAPKTPKTPLDTDYRLDEDLEQVKARTAALAQEAQMVGLSVAEQEKRRVALDLEQQALSELRKEAQQKGVEDLDSIKLSDEQRAKIDAVAAAYGRQAEATELAHQQQQRLHDLQQEFGSLAEDSILGLVDGTKDLNDALADTLKLMAKMLLQSALLGDGALGNGGGGLIGAFTKGLTGLLGSGFDGGGYTGAGGKYDPAGVVHRGEVVWSQDDIRRAGGVAVVEAMRRGAKGYANGGAVGIPSVAARGITLPKIQPAARGGSVTFSPVTTIDARGSQMGEAQMRAILAENNRMLMKQVPAAIDAQRRRTPMDKRS